MNRAHSFLFSASHPVHLSSFIRVALFSFICLVLISSAYASLPEEIVEKVEQLGLAQHPTWRKLIHYEDSSKESVVLTNKFFLSPNGKKDPAEELTATVNAYFLPW